MSDDRLDDLTPPTPVDAPETPLDEPADSEPAATSEAGGESSAGGFVGIGEGEAPVASEAATADDSPPVRPREVIRGIHPELICSCPECDPEFVELQWFSPEEQKKTKGQIMLFCGYSGRKYFSPAVDLHAWVAENVVVKRGRARAEN